MRGAKQKEMFELSDLRRETFTFGPSVCFSPGGGDLIFLYIRRLGPIFLFKSLNFNIFLEFSETEYFCGVITNWTILCILWSFLKVKVQNGGYFLGCKNFKYLFGVLEILDIFWEWTVDAGPEPTYEEIIRVPPHPGVCPSVQTYPC